MTLVRTKRLEWETIQSGPKKAPVVILIHGWPDNAHTWDSISPFLNEAGFRTVALMQRGFGRTRFLSPRTPRTGNVGVLALDVIELANALGLGPFFVAGHDWGSNIAETLALAFPRRISKIAMLSSPSRLGGLATPSFAMARLDWYHWFQATKRGAEAIAKDPSGFARIMWDTWSPPGWYDEKTFRSVAKSFSNPDWIPVTLHSYRSRWGEAPVDRRSLAIETLLKSTKELSVPTLFLHGSADKVTPPETTEKMAAKFTGLFERVVLKGVGHFPTREAPERVGPRLVRHFSAA